MPNPDHYNLQRFVDAQVSTYTGALAELRAGRKTGHWIWFIFPQVRGLGQSPTSVHYAIAGMAEAKAHLAHPTLGPRLLECVSAVLAVPSRTAPQIFGDLDAMKFRSSMTLFNRTPDPIFQQALDRFFGGQPDPATLSRL